MSLKRLCALLEILSWFSIISAHMQMSWPYPLRSPLDPKTPSQLKDYNMVSPLNANGDDYACKGYQYNTLWRSTASYFPGKTYNLTLAGDATHGGGSCQISISNDNGATFKVLKSIIGGCPLAKTYNFTVPYGAPSGPALLAWTWFNYEGNREMYMNCAVVDILVKGGIKSKRNANSALARLPNVYIANLADINSCKTIEMEDVVFPDPGKDVEYGGGMNAASSASGESGQCNGFGKAGTVEAQDENQDVPALLQGNNEPVRYNGEWSSPTSTGPVVNDVIQTTSTGVPKVTIVDSAVLEASALKSLPADGSVPTEEPTAIVGPNIGFPNEFAENKVGPDELLRAATAPSPQQSPAGPFGPLRECIKLPDGTVTIDSPPWCKPTPRPGVLNPPPPPPPPPPPRPTRSLGGLSVVAPINTPPSQTRGPIPPPGIPSPPTKCDFSKPPYATGDPSTYLPCHPGTFLCISPLKFLNCIKISNGWAYGAVRDVAAGIKCRPYLTPNDNPGTEPQAIDWGHYMGPGPVIPLSLSIGGGPFGGAGNGAGGGSDCPVVVPGYYRDDKYVSATSNAGGVGASDSSCTPDGSYKCNGPTGFSVCNFGQWMDMGKVAAGTKCVDGKIIAA